eukprot:TRINITY_DN10405_c0_g1_i1.p1 TRINITY_DN10405_c0_g1~~TRINITY_DN10405_c0_g1_i1.p1  ORF type:complete len:191 (-),score=15.93 TRINITY_DN10405_c0_g1_i1:89-661(-)
MTYDTSGHIVEFGANDMARIYRLARVSDDLISRMTQINARKRYSYRPAMLRNNRKIRNLVQDLHRKSAKFLFLCESYSQILLAKFDTQKTITKKNGRRRLHSKTDDMGALPFPSASGVQVYGVLRPTDDPRRRRVHIQDLRSMRTHPCETGWQQDLLRCPQCKFETDRDWNGAQNIYMKNESLLSPHTGG